MATIRVDLDLALPPGEAFDLLVEELGLAAERRGLDWRPGAAGALVDGGVAVGEVIAWEPGSRLTLRWHPADWAPDVRGEVELRLEPAEAGSRAVLEHRGWGGPFGAPGDLLGWFTDQVVTPLLAATAPRALGDWLTDRGARRPSGAVSREVYRDPLYHRPGFRFLLAELAPTAQDRLLDVGCGGGAFLQDALATGCTAAAVDHSPDMVRLARRQNRDAVAAGRLEVHLADAAALPFADAAFTCAALHGVLGFLPDPVAALAEIRRVLAAGGRAVLAGTDPELRDTPAAPEPMASRLRFYDDEDLAELARAAGYTDFRVLHADLGDHARAVGIPAEHLGLFAGTPARFLVLRR